MTRWNLVCTKCRDIVKFRHAGEVCDRVHDSPYIIECDCTGVPASNWSKSTEPSYWQKNEKTMKIVKRSDTSE